MNTNTKNMQLKAKGKNFALCGLMTAALLCSCNADDISGDIFSTLPENAIGFEVASNKDARGTAVTPQNFTSEVRNFQTWGYYAPDATGSGVTPGKLYLGKSDTEGTIIKGDGKGGWSYNNPLDMQYWPATTAPLNFQAISPSTDPSFTIENTPDGGYAHLTAVVTVPADVKKQKDIIFGKADAQTIDTNNQRVSMSFAHGMAQVTFKVKVVSDNIKATLHSVELCNVHRQGKVGFMGQKGELRSIVTDLPNASFSVGLNGLSVNSVDAVDVTASDGALFMLPQTTTAWESKPGQELPLPERGGSSYMKVRCTVVDNITGTTISNKNEVKYIPFAANWKMGEKYEYTLVFGETNTDLLPPPPSLHENVWYVLKKDQSLVKQFDNIEDVLGVAISHQDRCFVIEKHETNNTSYQSLSPSGKFCYGKNADNPVITNHVQLTQSINANQGYMADINNKHYGQPEIGADLTQWTGGVLNDFNGIIHSDALKGDMTTGTHPSIGSCLASFTENSTDNANFKDWYIPSLPQMALVYHYLPEINKALLAIGGTPVATERYWTSSESNTTSAWSINMANGNITSNSPESNKSEGMRVRFVRDSQAFSDELFKDALVGIFTVPENMVGKPINILGNPKNFSYNKIKAIMVDGMIMGPMNTFIFTTSGPHTVKYVLVNPERMPTYLFSYVNELTGIVFPSTATVIETAFVYATESLKTLTIPEGIIFIEGGAFSARNLNSIHFPSTVKGIGRAPVVWNIELKIITIAEGNKYYSVPENTNCLVENDSKLLLLGPNLPQVNIPKNIKVIGSHAFNSHYSIEFLEIPEGVKRIDMYVFYSNYKLTNIILPSTLTLIDNESFARCTKLALITSHAPVAPQLGTNVFSGISNTGILKVPQGATGYEVWLQELGPGWSIEYLP